MNSPNPRLLFFMVDSGKSGMATQLWWLTTALTKQYEVHLLAPPGWLKDQLADTAVHYHQFHDEAPRHIQRRQVNELYQLLKPVIIHCHGVKAGIIGRQQKTAAKMVYTEHHWTTDYHLQGRWREWLQIRLMQAAARNTDHTIAVSEAVKKFLLRHGLTDDAHLSLIYGGIKPLHQAKPPTAPVVGTLSRLTWIKGVDMLLKALPEVLKICPSLICRIGGDGPDKVHLQKLSRALGIERSVKWEGEIADPASFFDHLSLYIQPSLSEAFGVALLQAMSSGVPVVASAAGALPEAVQDLVNGRLFPPLAHHKLAKIIIQLLLDDQARRVLSQAARKRASLFSVTKMVEAHHHLYLRLLK